MKKIIKPIIYFVLVLVLLYLGYHYADSANLFSQKMDYSTLAVIALLSLACINISIVAVLSFLSVAVGKK